jgi:four helix bundle protein
MEKPNLIAEKTFSFALSIINICQQLNTSKEFDIKRQLFKSGTSIGANVQEAIGASSLKDFVAKMNIALKEARETKYWLSLITKSHHFELNVSQELEEVDSILKILSAIVKSTKIKLEKN